MPYIFRDKDDVILTPQQNAHGGKGTILVREVLGHVKGSTLPGNADDFEAPINFVHVVNLPPKTSIGMHPHDNNEEFYYVMEGQATMVMKDEKTFIMNAGSICLIKKGSHHAIENNTDNDLVVMVMEAEFSK